MRRRWAIWVGPPLILGLVAQAWSFRAARSDAPSQSAPTPMARPTADTADPRLRHVLGLLRNDPSRAWPELVALYGRLAGDSSAVAARAAVLNVAFSEPALGLRLKHVLEVVDTDPTPPSQDPLWPELVSRLADQWSGSALTKGRDLMLMETRQRPQRALVDSFIELVRSERRTELLPEASQALLTDLIDMHARVSAEQRPRIEEAVRKLGGNDPADLLAGHGLNGGKKLEIQAEYERNLQAGIDSLMKGKTTEQE